MTDCSFDFETFSEVDLPKVGSSRYAKHPSTELLMVAWRFGAGPIKQTDILSKIGPRDRFRSRAAYIKAVRGALDPDFRDALDDPRVTKRGWNCGQFERVILRDTLDMGLPPDEWRDTMVLALSCSFPGKLALAMKAAGFDEDDQKSASGTSLIKYWSQPRKPTIKRPERRNLPHHDPEKWKKYLDYNRQDVHTESLFAEKFADFDMPEHEWRLWELDQKINDRGIPINLNMVDAALDKIDYVMGLRNERLREITGLDNPNSGAQFLPWLRAGGYPFLDLKKGHIARAIEQKDEHNFDDLTLEALKLRQETSKASVKKYAALYLATDDDGNLRYALQFAAAGRTWRWGGRKYQPQNLARPHLVFEKMQEQVAQDIERMAPRLFDAKYTKISPKHGSLSMDALSTGVRPVVQAPDGYVFADADLNAIENRVLGWLADDQKILDVFRLNQDPYVSFAVYLFAETYEKLFKEYKAGDKKKRTTAKPGVLGCGYMLGPGQEYENEQTGEIEATGLLGYAWNMGVREFTLQDSIKSVEIWRRTFRKAVQYWYDVHEAMFDCVADRRRTYCRDVEFVMRGDFCECWLPSGRALKYHLPRIKPTRMPWGDMRDSITYMNLDDRNQWVRVSTHPGKVTENIDQAISRDLLAHGMKNAEAEGLKIRLHVHDQIAALVKERDAEAKLKLLIECMSDRPSWAPGLPLAAAGTVNKWFTKD